MEPGVGPQISSPTKYCSRQTWDPMGEVGAIPKLVQIYLEMKR